MKSKVQKQCTKTYYSIVLAHIIISFITSCGFFEKLIPDVGIENKAYVYYCLGGTLKSDIVSRILCLVGAYILAVVLICLIWRSIFTLLDKKNDKVIFLYIILLMLGSVCVLALYPNTYGIETTDDYMNYVYAKEFLPMYWHGYFTNVIYCACMIVLPHPVSIPLAQWILGETILFYWGYTLYKHMSEVKRSAWTIIIGIVTMPVLFPYIIRILFYPTRNCMYAIGIMGLMTILYNDYLKRNQLTKSKFVLLAILFAIAGSWRGEGIIYIVAFPVLLYLTYRRNLNINDIWNDKNIRKKALKAISVYVFFCVICMMPDKYGVIRYQNSDYMIANTTGPLSVVFNNKSSNLSYKGAKEDIEAIEKVVPIEYIISYGCNGGFFYNVQSGRWARQSGSTKTEGQEYVLAAYNILLHNVEDYMKYQINLFLESNRIGSKRFNVYLGTHQLDDWMTYQPYIRASELYETGEQDLLKYDYIFINQNFEEIVCRFWERVSSRMNSSISGYIKATLVVLTVLFAVVSMVEKNWWYFWISAINLALLMIILLMAPAVRSNYYYSVFLQMYCLNLYNIAERLKKNSLCKISRF